MPCLELAPIHAVDVDWPQRNGTDPASILERVKLGMYVLDQIAPNWRYQIHVQSIDVQDENGCPLGQLFGDFTEGTEILGRYLNQNGLSYWKAAALGFGRFDPESSQEWVDLTNAWKEQLDHG